MKALRHIFEWFQLLLPCPLSTLHGLLCHLPDKAFLEFGVFRRVMIKSCG